VRDVRRVPGVVVPRFGIVDFDVDVDAGGSALYVSEGRFGRGAGPAAARLVVFTRARTGFVRVQRVGAITGFAEAPSLSSDGRTLYYHRRVGRRFGIYFVTR